MIPERMKTIMNASFCRTNLVLVCSFLFLSCMSSEDQQLQENQQLHEENQQRLVNSTPEEVTLEFSLNGSSRAERFLGTFDEIDNLTLDLIRQFDQREIKSGIPLTRDSTSKWSATLNNLIVDFVYDITGHAYRRNDNGSQTEIFRGDTDHKVEEGLNSLSLRLSPILDNRVLSVPRITRVNRPFQMEKDTQKPIKVSISNVDLHPLNYRFRSVDVNTTLPLSETQGGSFSPSSGTHQSDNISAYPDIETDYTAPDQISVQKLQVRVTNDVEIGISTSFKTYVTGPIESETAVDTNPVIESISAEREDETVLKWTLLVSDDEPFSELVSKWEYDLMNPDDTRTFSGITYNDFTSTSSRSDVGYGRITALMQDYQDSDSGVLRVTVCEGGTNNVGSCSAESESSTSIMMELVANAYVKPIIMDCESVCVGLFDSGIWNQSIFGE